MTGRIRIELLNSRSLYTWEPRGQEQGTESAFFKEMCFITELGLSGIALVAAFAEGAARGGVMVHGLWVEEGGEAAEEGGGEVAETAAGAG